MEVATSQSMRRFSMASTSASTDYEGASLWSDEASQASSPGTSYSSSFGRSPPFSGRRRASTCTSTHLDQAARLQPLSEHIEEIVEITAGGNPGLGFSDSPPPSNLATPFETESSGNDKSRPSFAKRLYSNTKRNLHLTRPKLERREAGPNGDEDESARSSRTPSFLRSKRFKQLKGRFAFSAPVTPAFTPSPSTDKVHLFRSRPSSIVLRGTGQDLQASFYFDALPGSPVLDSASASSCYVPALEELSLIEGATAATEIVENKPRNLFDAILPKEIRIQVFSKVIENSVEEHIIRLEKGDWTAKIAADKRWTGESAGLRTLVGLSRVSRAWQDLAFDGQLWQNVKIAKLLGCDVLRPASLVRIADCAGSCLRKLDLRGFRNLQDEDLRAITDSCRAGSEQTNLDYIDLTGCRDISTDALHQLLERCPQATTLKVRALPAFVSSTCYGVISKYVKQLKHLDVSLCRNLLAAALLDLAQPGLQILVAGKIPSMDDATVSALPGRFPALRDLDLGYSRHITDAAFARWPGAADGGTRIRSLRLSSCTRLTDQACLNLVGKVNELECLELASIGNGLREGGLIKLIESLRNLRKIDLEDATHLSDRVIAALAPVATARQRGRLEHAILTNLPEITEPALIRMVKFSPWLRVVECSNSFHVSDAFVKAFLLHIRRGRIQSGELNVVDCRNIGRRPVRDYGLLIRPRRGVADYANRHFGYMDDQEVKGSTILECDEARTVVHSFWTWAQVDEAEAPARAARTAQLALEGGGSTSHFGPSLLRHARRASFGLRSPDGPAGPSCIVS